MSAIATICLHMLIGVQEVCQAIVEYCYIIPLACGIWAFNPYQMAGPDADAELIPECRLTSILVRCVDIAFCGSSFLIDTEVSTVDAHQTVIQDVVILPLFKINLRFGKRLKKEKNA